METNVRIEFIWLAFVKHYIKLVSCFSIDYYLLFIYYYWNLYHFITAVSNLENVEPVTPVSQKWPFPYDICILYSITAGLVAIYRHNMNNNNMRSLQQYDSELGTRVYNRLLIGEHITHLHFVLSQQFSFMILLVLAATMHTAKIFVLFLFLVHRFFLGTQSTKKLWMGVKNNTVIL